ncbi:Stress responsive A/B Barrel Domain [Singulisphaera sp. GP187]|uniref:Dabb family protein n=1 Tax=Singulisphaera sp. GP187 TaxID=1882752 RepID=UPI000928C2A6|nr:Dabb family protein [Singulisphaera sp. GP187]SIO25037.1 Stress responsive A/B Barrel Domain [Singulisphaera sp. GP187]
MNRFLARLALCSFAVSLLAVGGGGARAADEKEERLAHVVFFTLKDHSKESRMKMLDACKTYLRGHDGLISFSAGIIAEDVTEPVSDRDFDVAVHLVFRDKAANAAYQAHPRHKQFVEENKASWAKVRVFDSYLAAP